MGNTASRVRQFPYLRVADIFLALRQVDMLALPNSALDETAWIVHGSPKLESMTVDVTDWYVQEMRKVGSGHMMDFWAQEHAAHTDLSRFLHTLLLKVHLLALKKVGVRLDCPQWMVGTALEDAEKMARRRLQGPVELSKL